MPARSAEEGAMKASNNGWFAAVGVAVAAIFGISVLPTRTPSPSPASETPQKDSSVERGLPPKLEAPCGAIEKTIRAFLPRDEVVAPPGCFAGSGKAAKR